MAYWNNGNNIIRRIILLFAIGIFLVFTAGCGMIRLFPEKKPIPESEPRERSALEEAYQRFDTGDFENASAIFEQLCKDAGESDIRNRALYGLACSRLILAEDDDAMDEAFRFWNTWSYMQTQQAVNSEPESLAGTDPRMLTPLIHRIIINGFVDPQIAFFRSEDTQAMSEAPDDFPAETVEVVAAVPEEDACETQLEDREKQIRKMEKKLTRMRRRIRKLKKQIDSLENIHRTIQEKKRELHYP